MEQETLLHTIAVARGDEPADLVLKNGRVVNVFTAEILERDVAVAGEHIAAVGNGYRGREEIDLDGCLLVPGLIDTHVHLESSLVSPQQFALTVVPHGVTTVIADPHEIANVCGLEGIHYLLESTEGLPLTVFFKLPSCVPATHLGTAGAELGAKSLSGLHSHPRVLGLAEFMNVPGAVLGMEGAIEKLVAFADSHIDGHAPGCSGPWLQAYAAAGPATDHETMTPAEALEKVQAGMYVLLREASAARNLRDLLPAVTAENSRRFAFATDDRHPTDLVDQGSIDNNLRLAIEGGLDPVDAVRIATINGAEAFGLRDRGAISPGRLADLVVTRSLENFKAVKVFSHGRLVAEGNRPLTVRSLPAADERSVRDTIRVETQAISLRIAAEGKTPESQIRAIEIVPDQLVTEQRLIRASISNGEAIADPSRDLLKLAVIERHRYSGRTGLGFICGLGITRGAIASSVGHDCHNITVAGSNDADMLKAVEVIKNHGGGLVAVVDGNLIAGVPLPIAGLMSDQPVAAVCEQMKALLDNVHKLGSTFRDPFKYLSFMALEVIPKLKITDRGLVDVEKFNFTPLWVE